jgi:nucleoside-diphosphate-sugar epimerase
LERPRREDDPPQPVNGYGRSKLASEAVIREGCRAPWTILRPCSVYGPRDHGFLPLFQLARRGLSLLAMPASTPFSFVFIDDLVRAVQAAATDPRAVGETFFVGHPEAQRVEALGRALAESFGRGYRPLRLPPVLVDAMAFAGEIGWKLGWQLTLDRGRLAEFRAAGFVGSTDRIRDRLGFVATMPLRDGIGQTARWYLENGWI